MTRCDEIFSAACNVDIYLIIAMFLYTFDRYKKRVSSFDSEFSNIVQSMVRLVWDPLKEVVQDTFSVKIDLHQMAKEIKEAIHASYENIRDLLNLEKTI